MRKIICKQQFCIWSQNKCPFDLTKRLFKMLQIFITVKMSIFSLMFCTRFLLFFFSTDCGYTFENGMIFILK